METKEQTTPPKNSESTTDNSVWKLLIVDDDQSIHDITKLVLSDMMFDGKKLTFYHAYNVDEAKKVIQDNPDIAIIILDVVMESENAGLILVKYIRDELKNELVRIILRTGQPGAAPEGRIVAEYDINDYKEKTELTSSKLNTLIVTSLRAYKELTKSVHEQIVIRQEAEASLLEKDEYLKLITDALPVLISFIDSTETIQFYNKTYQVWFNKKDTEITGLKIKDLIGEEAYLVFKESWDKAMLGHTINFDMKLKHFFFGIRNTNVTLVPHTYSDNFRGCFSLISDITERKQIEENLNYLAKHDVLTGLYNRTYFNSYINQAIRVAIDRRKILALLFIDVDEFKKINDTKGHEYGDVLLLSVSTRLKECVRASDIICRFGGDEFVILLENLADVEEIKIVADKIIKAIATPFMIKNQKISVTTSMGISLCPNDSEDKDVLLKNADLAMYKVKEEGKNGYQFYTSDLFSNMSARFEIENDLRASLLNEEFEMYYQPIIDLKTYDIVAVEALVRWNHPSRGMMLPHSFIPLTEDTGTIIPFSEWILKTSCFNLRRIHEEGFPKMKVSVNISASQFITHHFVDFVKDVLKKTGVPGKFLQLELTESTLITNFDVTFNNIQLLKQIDVEVLLDDFGSGFSSLNYLARLPIAGIKIDESFSKLVAKDLRSAAIVSTITQLMRCLNIKTIVEAIETADQLYFAKSCNCDMVQGFLIAPPTPIKDVKNLLTNLNVEEIIKSIPKDKS